MQVELSDRAQRNLQSIADFIQTGQSAIARRWLAGLVQQIESLNQLSDRGSPVRVDQRYRQLLYGKKPNIYRIVYRVYASSGKVVVTQVRHGARRDIR